MALIVFWVLWGVLALAVLALFVTRQLTASHENDSVHLAAGEVDAIIEQNVLGSKLERIDKWGKTLTVVAAAYLIVLLCAQLYHAWVTSNSRMF